MNYERRWWLFRALLIHSSYQCVCVLVAGWDWHTEPQWHTRKSNLTAREAAAMAAVDMRAIADAAATASAATSARRNSKGAELMHEQAADSGSSFLGDGLGESSGDGCDYAHQAHHA